MQRFFVVPFRPEDSVLEVTGDLAHQIKNVLRCAPGDSFLLLDNEGSEYDAALVSVHREKVVLEIRDKRKAEGEPPVQIKLYQSLVRKDRLEFVLQKGTEIGVACFAPVIAHRCVSLYRKGTDKLERWSSIVKEAAEQSGRGFLPTIEEPVTFRDACGGVSGFPLIFWECERETNLYEALKDYSPERHGKINIFIGPEGGFTTGEIELARDNGIRSVSLSPRILRSETAALVAAANILYHLTDVLPEMRR